MSTASRVVGLVIGVPSCLVSSAMFWLCQRAGWTSDGPGLLCLMIIGALAALCAFAGLKAAFWPAPPDLR
jgi:hypothetical protein